MAAAPVAASAAFPSLLRRLASLVYDALLLLAILFLAALIFLLFFGSALEAPKRQFFQAYLWLISAAYFIWCWLHGGQTLAMKTWHIRLVNLSGTALTLNQAAGRYVLASMGLMLFGIGFFWALFDKNGFFLHDRLMDSRLVISEKTEADVKAR